jgi:hypothetical protein
VEELFVNSVNNVNLNVNREANSIISTISVESVMDLIDKSNVDKVNNMCTSIKVDGDIDVKCVKKSMLKCCFFNARGLLGKLDELKVVASELDLDVIGIAETWLTAEIDNAEIALEGYKVLRKDRSEIKTGKHGGVMMYIRENIVTRECGGFK